MCSTHHASSAFIGVGSNMGDRLAMIADAAQLLADTTGIYDLFSSPIYETRPIGPVGTQTFLNAAFQLSLRIAPMQLFSRMQEIETALGRRPPRNGPRPIDLDLLFYDDLVVQNDVLVIPHPRLTRRAFVLQPLADLAADICHPETGLSVSELLALLPEPSEIIGRFADPIVIAPAHAG